MEPIWRRSYPKGVNAEITLDKGLTLPALLEDTCGKFEHKEALTCMGTTINFRQFDRRAEHFASYLQQVAKVGKGDRVAIMLPNLIQFPIALFGVLKVGGVCVNTNPLYTPREMRHQFKDSGAKVIVILDMFLDKLEEVLKDTDIKHVIVTSIGDQLPVLKGTLISLVMKFKGLIPKHNLAVTSFKHALAEGSRLTYERPALIQDDVAILQYTGGTTGVSKGAMLTHRNLLANVFQVREWAMPFLQPGGENVLTALPLYHVFALSINFLTFISMGCRMILLPKPVPIENTVKAFKQHKVTIMTGVNTLFNALNNNREFRELAPKDIRFAIAGGMALQKAVADKFQSITGTKVLEGFGLTEASPVTHCNPFGVETPAGSCGLPLPSTDAKIVDENGRELGVGEVGELVVRGPQIMKGYWKRDDETAKCIKEGWLWTGDMCKVDEKGFFYVVDRKKDMIVVSGFNVYPNEIEDVLASHPKVLEAAVIGETARDGSEMVKAFVVAKDKSLTEEELKRYCEKELTGYKRPRLYEFRDELPKTNVGKILRRELRTTPPVAEQKTPQRARA